MEFLSCRKPSCISMIISILSGSFTLYMYDHFTLYRLVIRPRIFARLNSNSQNFHVQIDSLRDFSWKSRTLCKKRKNEFATSLKGKSETAVSFGTEMTDCGENVNMSNARKIIWRFRYGRRSFPFVTPEIPARFHRIQLGGNRVLEQQLPTDPFFRPRN